MSHHFELDPNKTGSVSVPTDKNFKRLKLACCWVVPRELFAYIQGDIKKGTFEKPNKIEEILEKKFIDRN